MSYSAQVFPSVNVVCPSDCLSSVCLSVLKRLTSQTSSSYLRTTEPFSTKHKYVSEDQIYKTECDSLNSINCLQLALSAMSALQTVIPKKNTCKYIKGLRIHPYFKASLSKQKMLSIAKIYFKLFLNNQLLRKAVIWGSILRYCNFKFV